MHNVIGFLVCTSSIVGAWQPAVHGTPSVAARHLSHAPQRPLPFPHAAFTARSAHMQMAAVKAAAAPAAKGFLALNLQRAAALPLAAKLTAAAFIIIVALSVTIFELVLLSRAIRTEAECELGDEESCAECECTPSLNCDVCSVLTPIPAPCSHPLLLARIYPRCQMDCSHAQVEAQAGCPPCPKYGVSASTAPPSNTTTPPLARLPA